MSVASYDYDLPAAAIAQVPLARRDAARLLVAVGDAVSHRHVADLPSLVGPGDVIVVNETRVLPARLRLRKPTGGAVEVLLLERRDDGWWDALVRPSRRVQAGTRFAATDGLVVEVGAASGDGRRAVRLHPADGRDEDSALAAAGEVALPPYIGEPLADAERYQTVFARRPGSVAAPTAGLHLTAELLDACRAAGAVVARVDLSVGLDTFRPITAERLDEHVMHSERYCVPAETTAACAAARRVVAVGTTTVRALESAARGAPEGRTSLFVRPGFEFRVVDVLLTNFHLPRSTLLVLLHAFCGERWRDLYAEALRAGYRFLSFGDAMLVDRDAA